MSKPPYRTTLDGLERWWDSLPASVRIWVWIILAGIIALCFLIDAITR